jgi:DNA (cytosine-5)-methyltransferase 1
MMTFGSVCSGIEAASVAWEPLGWKAAFVSEIDKAACAVLAHHYPDTPNLGDMTKWETWPDAALDVLVGGTPCQSFSVAGLRKGLDDPRGSLMLVFGAIARRYCPRWIVWENVPGVLSSNGGRDFGAFLGMLGELGYGFAYRVLDAQFFGLAQRRARVFVVAHLGDWRPPAAVLFERESLRGDIAPRREAGQRVAQAIRTRPPGFSGQGNDFEGVVANTLTAHTGIKVPDYTNYIPATWPHNVAGTLDAHYGSKWGFEDQHINAGAPNFVTHAFSCKDHGGDAGEIAPTLRAMGHHGSHPNAGGQVAVAFAIQGAATRENPKSGPDGIGVRADNCAYTLEARSEVQAVAFAQNQRDEVRAMDIAGALAGEPGMKQQTFIASTAVRRLTPRECERLQGFPDDYTAISYRGKQMADGPRYKMLGNSMAVPVMAWIGERIALVDGLKASLEPTP